MRSLRLLAAAIAVATLAPPAFADDGAPPPPGKELRVYHFGNSHTRNVPLERLQTLFQSVGGKYDYGTQLGGGLRLEQHLVRRGHSEPPGEAKLNLVKPYGAYDHALRNFTFDAIVMQPYLEELDREPQVTERWPFFRAGVLQAAGALIDYSRGKTKAGEGRWDLEHPNEGHVASETFYIYATWPTLKLILGKEGDGTFAEYWNRDYQDGVQPSRDFFAQLVDGLNKRNPDLKTPVRMIPAGDVLAKLDVMIRDGDLPGIEAFYERNQPYYRKARGARTLYNPEAFDRSKGVLNFYADNTHMNDQPHNGPDSGTIGSYVVATTIFATLTGESPVGLTVEPYEMLDAEADAELIDALQKTVWEVVAGHPHTGVPAPDADSANDGAAE